LIGTVPDAGHGVNVLPQLENLPFNKRLLGDNVVVLFADVARLR